MSVLGIVLFHSGVLLASLAIIAFSGDYFIDALTNYAKKIGMSTYFIGMVVVAVATSSPDIATSVMGIIQGKFEILSGVILGGLMLDVAFLNGLFAILGKKIKVKTDVIKGIEYVVLGLIILPDILILDGELTRSEGLAMVLSFFIYILLIWQREKTLGQLKKKVQIALIWQDALVFLLALFAMLLAAKYAVFSVTQLSTLLNIPLYILSITVLAFAAALPDGISGTLAILRGQGAEIGFGENIGTTLLEINLFTGIIALIKPIEFGVMPILIGTLGIMGSYVYFLTIMRKGTVTTKHGLVFMGIYVLYLTLEIWRAF